MGTPMRGGEPRPQEGRPSCSRGAWCSLRPGTVQGYPKASSRGRLGAALWKVSPAKQSRDRFPLCKLQCCAAELPVYFQSPAVSPEALPLLLFGLEAS